MALSATESKILRSIVIPSENSPLKPEFPPDNPKFPATPTFEIQVPGFENVWIKDESVNPTGTHKDRMAWEMVVTYRDILIRKDKGQIYGDLPPMSIISSGSAAIAIQTMLRKYALPNLKVLVDVNMDDKIVNYLKKIGCEVYVNDLSKKPLEWREILELTNNDNGFDITSNHALDHFSRFYDWMSYEILNSSPDYCFIPFGTANLYENILNINKKEVTSFFHDPRFRGEVKDLRQCNFIGATTNNPKSKADKLYSPHLPFAHFDEQWIRSYKYAGYCGPETDVHLLQERYLDEAMKIAQKNGVDCEPSGIAGLALMLQMKNKLPKNKKMLIVNTGKTKFS
ncbi:MAG TPA: PLP-dependent lyase/thiolase [archaeon]|nr:PLP-dependent lyase/thiolase [archaeon]